MKILITTDSYKYQVNGVTTSVLTLKEELINKGHDVRVLALSPKYKSFVEDCDYYIASTAFPIYPDARVTLRSHDKIMKQIMDWNPDIIHIQTEFSTMMLGKQIAHKLNKPYVNTCHTKYEDYVAYFCPSKRLGKLLVKGLSKKVYRHSETLVVPSEKIKDLEESYHLKCPIVVIPTGIDMTKYHRVLEEEERKELKKCYNIPEGITLLVSVCRLGVEKNIQEILDYMPELLKANPDVRYMIVGDGPYREKLESKVKKLKLTNRVFFTGMIPSEEVYKYYQLGDIFVSASTSETQGLTFVEALANGKPLVCKEDGCLKGVIYQAENGYTFRNKTEFIDSIQAIISAPELKISMGIKSEEISQRFTKEQFGTQVESLYLDILEKERA